MSGNGSTGRLWRPEYTRRALELRKQGLTYAEIAIRLDVGPDTVRRWLCRVPELRRPWSEADTQRAVSLRSAGWTYEAIARELGFSDRVVRAKISDGSRRTTPIAGPTSDARRYVVHVPMGVASTSSDEIRYIAVSLPRLRFLEQPMPEGSGAQEAA